MATPEYDAEMTLDEYNAIYGGTPAPEPTYDAVMTADEYNAMYGPKNGSFFSMNTAENAPKSLIKGAADLAGMATLADPVNLMKSAYAGASDWMGGKPVGEALQTSLGKAFEGSNQIKDIRQEYVGEPVYESKGGQYLGKALEMVPSAAIPGGTIGGRLLSAVSSGVGGQAALDAGLPEVVGNVGGGMLPGLIKAAGPKLAKSAEKLQAAALGATKRQQSQSTSKLGRKLGEWSEKTGYSTPLNQEIDSLRKQGFFKGSMEPDEVLKKASNEIDSISDDVTATLAQADKVRGAAKVYPKWKKVDEYIESLKPGDQAAARAQAQAEIEATEEALDGSLSSLQAVKKKFNIINKKYYDNAAKGPHSENLDIAMADDLRSTIENGFDRIIKNDSKATALSRRLGVGKEALSGRVKNLNRKIKERFTLGKMQLENINAESANYASKGPDKVLKALSTASSAGGGAGALSLLAGIDPVSSLAIGTGAYLARTPKGQMLRAAGRRTIGKGMEKIPANSMTSVVGTAKNLASEIAPEQVFREQPPEVSPTPVSTPQQLSQLIEQQDPLVRSVIAAESSGNPTAVSKTGAKGLMQLMPATAKAWGVEDPFDPIQNIEGGKKNLEAELKRFGDIRLALAAYNLGGTKLAAIIKRLGTDDYNRISHALPEETRKYVPKVMAMYNKFNTSKG